MLKIIQMPALKDNYIYIIHEPESGETAVIDPAGFQSVMDVLNEKNWSLNYIINTHHHWDHVDANLELKKQTQCHILASEKDYSRIPGIDKGLEQGDEIKLGNHVIKVIFTPGHTQGHIVFYCKTDNSLFCGDTLFSMGCGRLLEGSAEQMWHSLQQLKQLPDETKIYCAHEYTQVNGSFALKLEPENQLLQKRVKRVNELRAKNKATVPSTLAQELATNPFLREDSLALQQSIDMVDRPSIEIFKKIRQLKDNY